MTISHVAALVILIATILGAVTLIPYAIKIATENNKQEKNRVNFSTFVANIPQRTFYISYLALLAVTVAMSMSSSDNFRIPAILFGMFFYGMTFYAMFIRVVEKIFLGNAAGKSENKFSVIAEKFIDPLWNILPDRPEMSLAFIKKADTKQKRLCLVATPIVSAIALWLVIRDTYWFNYFGEIRFVTVLFVTLSIILPVASLTRLLNWINGE